MGDPDRRMEVIKNQVFRISEITRRLLDFARSSPTEFIAVPTDICAVIDGVIFLSVHNLIAMLSILSKNTKNNP
ncbi:MAG: hypothetical protein IPK11_15360 [Ignavibacteria bacterium]|nr:hypothetical protein [Ignavibacteria bacterium]